MLNTIIGAGIALLAGIIGATLTARFNRAAEHRQEQREVEKMAATIRRARRLVLNELEMLAQRITFMAERGHGPGTAVASAFLSTEEWQENKALLAETLPDSLWRHLPPLYDNIDALKTRLALRADERFDDDDVTRYYEMAEQAAVAASLLEAAGDPNRVIVLTDSEGRPI